MATAEQIKTTLKKQGSAQLTDKLRKGTLMNQSRTIAIEILKERKIDVSEFEETPKKVVKEAKSSKENPGPEMSHTNKGAKERPDVPKVEKKEEIKKEKAPKVKGEKKESKNGIIAAMYKSKKTTDDIVDEILAKGLSSITDRVKLKANVSANISILKRAGKL